MAGGLGGVLASALAAVKTRAKTNVLVGTRIDTFCGGLAIGGVRRKHGAKRGWRKDADR